MLHNTDVNRLIMGIYINKGAHERFSKSAYHFANSCKDANVIYQVGDNSMIFSALLNEHLKTRINHKKLW